MSTKFQRQRLDPRHKLSTIQCVVLYRKPYKPQINKKSNMGIVVCEIRLRHVCIKNVYSCHARAWDLMDFLLVRTWHWKYDASRDFSTTAELFFSLFQYIYEHSYSKRLLLLNLPSLELRRLHFDLIWCYKVIFGVVDISCSNIYALGSEYVTRGHPYKIFKRHCSCTARSSFFSERVIDTWNSLPSNAVNFTSLASFKRSISSFDFPSTL